MSISNFSQALGLTINYWDEIGIWSKNKSLLKTFLTLCTPQPNIYRQIKLINTILKYYQNDLILSLDDLQSILSILENTPYVSTTTVVYDEGVDYPVAFGINKIIKKYRYLGHEFLSRFISDFIATTYSELKLISYEEDDRKIYNAILAMREITFTNIVNTMINENKLPENTQNNSRKDIHRYYDYINNTTYFIEKSFWREFDYHPIKQNYNNPTKNKEEKKQH